jgi:hypothetical protein
MKAESALAGGVAGAVVLTLVHESVRRLTPAAPRMDLLGMEALAKTLDSVDAEVPDEDKLFKITMAGDILSNSLYYSLSGIGNRQGAVLRGTLLGIAAGIGSVYMPKPLGLHAAASSRTPLTKLLTVGLYTIGGFVAGAVGKITEDKRKDR